LGELNAGLIGHWSLNVVIVVIVIVVVVVVVIERRRHRCALPQRTLFLVIDGGGWECGKTILTSTRPKGGD